MKRLHVLGFVLLIASAAGCQQRVPGWHVSPTGSPQGDGSAAKPWDLKTAFDQPAAVKPGDTLWLHGGTYKITGLTTSKLTGAEGKPIVLRQAAGERATLDTGDTSANRIRIRGAYAWYWGFEVTSSATGTRVAKFTSEAPRGVGIDVSASDPNEPDSKGLKLINIVIHDTQGGIGFWSHAYEGEIYGSLVYYNGCNNHQHGIYTQNNEGVKRLVDNFIFDNSGWGIHAYGSSKAYLNNFHIEGNLLWNNGIIFKGFNRNIHVGGGRVAENPVVVSNYSYLDPALHDGGTPAEIGYGEGAKNAVVKDNYFSGPKSMAAIVLKSQGATVTGNTFYGPTIGCDVATYPDNKFYKDRPTGLSVMVRPNAYEKGRANIGVFNWDNLPTVKADVSKVLKKGDAYIVKDAQNFYGPAVAKGVYRGEPIELPMDLKETAPIIGGPMIGYDNEQLPVKQPVHTPREFGAFVLMKQP
jgi:hypothetical protein